MCEIMKEETYYYNETLWHCTLYIGKIGYLVVRTIQVLDQKCNIHMLRKIRSNVFLHL